MDKIGEVIGPKGKVINTIQQETGADIAVDDDGVQGTVTIGSVRHGQGRRGPPPDRADRQPADGRLGEVYTGRVVNITKFGAFVNILPGRDGLVHISKLGRGKRINRVEDVLDLGDEIVVRVDDIDPKARSASRPSVRRRRAARRRRWRRRAAPRERSERADRGDRGDRGDRAASDAPVRRPRWTPTSCRSRRPSTPRPARRSATSAPAATPVATTAGAERPPRATVAATAVAPAVATVAVGVTADRRRAGSSLR